MQESSVKLSILIPVRNEEASIRIILRILEAIIAFPHEILVVHDFPEDTTVPVVQGLQQQFSNVRLVHNKYGRGVANAIKAGVEGSRGQYIMLYTADEIVPILAINDMVSLLDAGCEFVSGTRYAFGGRRYGGSRIQFILSWLGNKIFQILSGSVLTDCTTGFKAFRKSIFDRITIESQAVSWSVAFELAIKAQAAPLKLGEVPLVSIDRLYGGQSTFSAWNWMREYLKLFSWGVRELRRAKNRQKNVMRLPLGTNPKVREKL